MAGRSLGHRIGEGALAAGAGLVVCLLSLLALLAGLACVLASRLLEIRHRKSRDTSR